MELEMYEAFKSAGINDEKAKAAVESVRREFKRQYDDKQLVTKADLKTEMSEIKTQMAELKAELIKWTVGSIFGAVGAFATIMKMMSH